MRRGAVAVVAALGLTFAACGDDGGGTEAGGGDPVAEAAGVEGIELVAPDEDGAGKVPTFEWEAVEGASTYRLVVLNGEDQPIWAWEGAETEVVLGAVPDRPEGEAGPVVTEGSTWSVAALDDEGHVIALSEERAVSP